MYYYNKLKIFIFIIFSYFSSWIGLSSKFDIFTSFTRNSFWSRRYWTVWSSSRIFRLQVYKLIKILPYTIIIKNIYIYYIYYLQLLSSRCDNFINWIGLYWRKWFDIFTTFTTRKLFYSYWLIFILMAGPINVSYLPDVTISFELNWIILTNIHNKEILLLLPTHIINGWANVDKKKIIPKISPTSIYIYII